jgi:hypothetical protein
MGEYINIYGLLFAKTADGKLAFTGQIWDDELQKFQSDINKLTPQLGEDGKLPADLPVRREPYDLTTILPRAANACIFHAVESPDAFLHEEPSYVTWTPQIHRAPV